MRNQRSRRRLRPYLDRLEGRRLLASSAQYAGVSPVDLAGPTAAVGPGGYTDLEIKVTVPNSSLPTNPTKLNSLTIMDSANANFNWAFGNPTANGIYNPTATATIVVQRETPNTSNGTLTFDAYFSPDVAVVNLNSGATTTQQLPSGNTPLTITDNYTVFDSSGNPTTYSESSSSYTALNVTITNLGSNLADSPTAPFSTTAGTYPGQIQLQTSDGNAHLLLSGLPANASINPATAELSDAAGLIWFSNTTTNYPHSRGELALTLGSATTANGTASQQINFPPERHETGATLTLLYQLNGASTSWYITDIAVPAAVGNDPYTNPNLRDGTAINPNATPLVVAPTSPNTPDMVTYQSGGKTVTASLQSLLNSTTYPIIDLGDDTSGNGTYTISQPIAIEHGMILQGQGSNIALNFTMTSLVQGAINFYASHITLNNFAIKFSTTVNYTASTT